MHERLIRYAGVGVSVGMLVSVLAVSAKPQAAPPSSPPQTQREIPPSPLRDRDGNPIPPQPPMRTVVVGNRQHVGPHTWRGMIDIASDSTIYENGQLGAPPASANGIPEGVTFQGDRRNITLRNLKFDGVGNGITIGNDQRVDDLTIERCDFVNCRTPDVNSKEHLEGSRGYGFFGSKGNNWTIQDSSFVTKCRDSASSGGGGAACVDFSVQYAMRLGEVRGLKVSNTKFENQNGKACMWLMFVHDAVFEKCEFLGGRITIGSRPGDMSNVESGDCRNITFRNCTFNFGVFDDWPASMNIFPGSSAIRFEGCTFQTKGDWWLEVDSRQTRNITWDEKCTWNGKPVSEFVGVRSSMSLDEMKAQGVGPIRKSEGRGN